jgi:quercetin dioxygenase-like cupin family protein
MGPVIHPLGFIGEAERIETRIVMRRGDFEPGDYLPGHDHDLPHATLVASGRFVFTDERTGATREVQPFHWIPVEARDMHGFRCLEAGTIFCIFAESKGSQYA